MPSISLCMIVKNEEEVIERCLASVQPLVEEIIIVDTGSEDNTVELCRNLGASVFHFEWCDDFAKARNFSFQKATCDYILWLDADDILEPDQLEALLKLKPSLQQDVYFLKYNYSQDEYGNPLCTFYRERIVKNNIGFKWMYPIHEVIDGIHHHSSSYLDISIKHLRTAQGHATDKGRNLSILTHAIQQQEYKDVPRMWYYYGRELFDHRDYKKAIDAFQKFLGFENTWTEDRMGALIKLAQCYFYLIQQENEAPSKENCRLKAREMARKAITQDDRWAEPYFILGDVAFDLGHYDEAVFWFKKCIRPLPDVLSPVSEPCYGIDAFVKLMFCHDHLKDYKQANEYNEKALEVKPNDVGLLHNRKYFHSLLYPEKKKGEHALAWYGRHLNRNFPTYRIRAMQMHQALNELGFQSEMVEKEEDLGRFDSVIFFKAITEAEFQVMKRQKALGKKVIFDIAEDLFDHTTDFPFYLPMLQAADLVICCSHALERKIRLYNENVKVIEDAVEPVEWMSRISETGNLTIGWIGMPENACHAERLRPVIESMGWKLKTIHTGPDCDEKWELESWQKHLSLYDAAMAPIDVQQQPCKSNNKITTYQSLGLPVIASPLEAYTRIIQHGENGLIASSQEEWKSSLELLKDSHLRNKLRKNGLATALGFRPKNLALQLMKAISPKHYNQQAVDIIIPTIYETDHLKYCIDSIIACTQIPYNIIVVHNGTHELKVPEQVTVVKGNRLNYSASINLGIAHGEAPYICMMNDDVIVSDGWLAPLLDSVRNGVDFCNPLSNCDAGSLHHYEMELEGVPLGPGTNMLYEGQIALKNNPQQDFRPIALYTYCPDSKKRKYLLEWVPFFCTLTSRKTIEKIGLLDDVFDNGCEDVDFCVRGRKMGFSCGVNEESFVFHFGGTSTMRFIQENPDQEGETHRVYREKYKMPLFVIHAGYSYEPWNGNTMKASGIGGSETAAALIAESFVRKGYRVVVFCECKGLEGKVNEVEYYHLDRFQHFIDRHYIDIFVLSRYANILSYPVRAAKKYFWIHDIWAMGTERGANDQLRAHIDELDGVFCLSPWHRDFVQKVHGLPVEKLIITGNGIDPARFSKPGQTIPNRFIYSSSPDRSLDVLLRLFPNIKAALPDATLHIYYGFENWNKSIEQSGNETQRALRDEIYKLMKQEGVYYHGRVNQDELAEAFLRSDIWLYPTRFTETFCITALEAQISRTLCICSDLAGLSSTVGDRGILLEMDPSQPGFDPYVLEQVLTIQHDHARKQSLLDRAREWALGQTWDHIATHWQSHFSPSVEVNKMGVEV